MRRGSLFWPRKYRKKIKPAPMRLQQPSGPHAKSWKKKRPAWPHCPPSFQTPVKSWQKSVKLLMRVCKRWLLPLAAIVLACLLVGCASTTKPSGLPPVPVVAPEVKAPIPPELLRLPDRPDPLEPGYAATH
nr:MAG TPA: ABC-type Fe3+ transport system, periplasmic binding protein [Caudoviricetes sp.]